MKNTLKKLAYANMANNSFGKLTGKNLSIDIENEKVEGFREFGDAIDALSTTEIVNGIEAYADQIARDYLIRETGANPLQFLESESPSYGAKLRFFKHNPVKGVDFADIPKDGLIRGADGVIDTKIATVKLNIGKNGDGLHFEFYQSLEEISRKFGTEAGFMEVTNSMVEQLSEGVNDAMKDKTKELIVSLYTDNLLPVETVTGDISTEAGASDFLDKIQEAIDDFTIERTYGNTGYENYDGSMGNSLGSRSRIEDIAFICDAFAARRLEKFLSTVYHLSQVEIQTRIHKVIGFGKGGDDILALVCDKNAVKIAKKYDKVRTNYDARNDRINFFQTIKGYIASTGLANGRIIAKDGSTREPINATAITVSATNIGSGDFVNFRFDPYNSTDKPVASSDSTATVVIDEKAKTATITGNTGDFAKITTTRDNTIVSDTITIL